MTKEEKIELLSDYMHNVWSKWFRYQSINSTPDNMKRWTEQSGTKYRDLSEEDKEKDRKFAREILDIERESSQY